MYSCMGLPTSIVIYCNDNSCHLHEYKGRGLQELVTMSCKIRGEYNKHPGNDNEFSGVAAEAAELCVLVASLTVPVCTFLFRTRSTHTSLLRTKY